LTAAPVPAKPSAAQPLAGYRLLRVLGRGGHATVHLALHESSGEPMALKLIELPTGPDGERAAAAFTAAAQRAARLRHPGIVAVLHHGLQPPIAWLAMEVVPGGDLGRYTQPQRLLPEALVLKLGQRMALALAYAHRQGVVHRDVKPANILCDWASDTIKLADFGLARADDGVQTGTGIVLGSPSYMPPELLAGALPTPRSDLYALGATLFHLLTGQLPYAGASMGELLRRVAEDPPPDARLLRPELHPAAAQVVIKLMAKLAGQRPLDGEEAARQLLDAAASWPPSL